MLKVVNMHTYSSIKLSVQRRERRNPDNRLAARGSKSRKPECWQEWETDGLETAGQRGQRKHRTQAYGEF